MSAITKIRNSRCLTKKRISNTNYKNNVSKEISLCHQIKNKKTLKNVLNKEYGNYITNKSSKIIHTLYPYCGEELTPLGTLDRVNNNAINIEILDILKDELHMKIIIDENIKKTNKQYFSNHSPKLFYDFLEQDIKNSKNNSHKLIISHGNFMKKLFKHIKNQTLNDETILSNIPNCDEKIFFDNLDIIMLRYNKKKDNVSLTALDIIRWKNNNDTYYDFSLAKKNVKYNNVIYIMRHCIGCHNTEGNTPIGLYKKIMIPGYGKYAFCLPIIINELKNEPIKKLKLLFKTYSGNNWNTTLTFGSSVIFRAILTNSIVQHMLKMNFKLK